MPQDAPEIESLLNLQEAAARAAPPDHPPPPQDDAGHAILPSDTPVNIPLQDVTYQVKLLDQVQETIALRQKLADDAREKEEAWSRSSEKRVGETDQQHQERIKLSFEEAVMAARRQSTAPPPPKQPVPAAIQEQTRREMEAGRKQSAYWQEQQKLRPLPTAKEIREAGVNTPVFRPGEYAHERGGVDKNLVTQRMPIQ